MNNTITGTVKFFNEAKGFGFIAEDNSTKEYFVHANNLSQQIQQNDKVEFEIREGRKGPEAYNVKKV
jgi:CspA family cold shock protein